jgi:hypothetical protein
MLTLQDLEYRKQKRYEFTNIPVVTTGSAYSAGNAVGGLITIGAVPTNTNKDTPFEDASLSVILQSALIADLDGQNKALNLSLFNAAPTTPVDKTAYAPTAADLKKLIGIVQFAAASYISINSQGVVQVANLGIVIKPTAGQIFGALYTGAAGTPTWTNGLQLKLQFSQGL